MNASAPDWPRLLASARGCTRHVVLVSDAARGGLDDHRVAVRAGDFRALLAAWGAAAAGRGVLHVITQLAGGWQPASLAQALADAVGAPAAAGVAPVPDPTRGLHRLRLGGVQWLLSAEPDVAHWLRELVARVDCFVLHESDFHDADGVLAPRRLRALTRLAAPDAVLQLGRATPPRARVRAGGGAQNDHAASWHAALDAAGFRVRDAAPDGDGHAPLVADYVGRGFRATGRMDRDAPTGASVDPARSATAAVPRAVPSARTPTALIVGAGVAGCAAAWALAEHGWCSTVVDRHPAPAGEASGNPAGLFHGVFHRNEGPHARLGRAAALELQRVAARAVRTTGVAGGIDGLLRLERVRNVGAMRDELVATGLPASYLQALDAVQASALCGWPLAQPAWLFPGGGWIDPAGLARAYLAWAGSHSRFVGSREVAALDNVGAPGSPRWRALDAAGRTIAEADAVVLANAGDALRLCPGPWPGLDGAAWLQRSRGQLSELPAGTPGLAAVSLPLSGAGYVMPPIGGQVLFGATTQPGDTDPALRRADHKRNLQQLAALTGAMPAADADACAGRAAFRWQTDDRLPLIGAAPQAAVGSPAPQRLEQPRAVPRIEGLCLYVGLGSRGITWSALGAQILASWVSGAPQPVESALVDAVDPARWVARAARRRS